MDFEGLTEPWTDVGMTLAGGEAYYVDGLQLALVMVVVTDDFLDVIEVCPMTSDEPDDDFPDEDFFSL